MTGSHLFRGLASVLLAFALPAAAQPWAAASPAVQASAESDAILAALVAVWPRSAVRIAPFIQVDPVRSQSQGPAPLAQIETQGGAARTSPSLGVEQIRAAPAGPSGETGQRRAQASGLLQSAVIRPGTGNAEAPEASTSANCTGTDSSAECMLQSKTASDWRRQTGVELDPVTGAQLVPGVTLNPTKN